MSTRKELTFNNDKTIVDGIGTMLAGRYHISAGNEATLCTSAIDGIMFA